MSLIKTLGVAALGYWLGEREGELRAEHSGRFRTLPDGRRVYDDTAPEWNDQARRKDRRWLALAILVSIMLWLAPWLPAAGLIVAASLIHGDAIIRLALIVVGLSIGIAALRLITSWPALLAFTALGLVWSLAHANPGIFPG